MKGLILSGRLISILMIWGACEQQGEEEIRAKFKQDFCLKRWFAQSGRLPMNFYVPMGNLDLKEFNG